MPDRVIRDELLTSERYWQCSPLARNLFVGIMLCADDCGRYTGSTFALASRCMGGSIPAGQVAGLLAELTAADLVRAYEGEADGATYLYIPRFRQRMRYPKSRYPDVPEAVLNLKKTVLSPSQDRPKSDSSPSQVSPKTAEVKRSEVNIIGTVSLHGEPQTAKPVDNYEALKIAAPPPAPPIPKPKTNGADWFKSNAGIEAKAKTLGLWPARRGESWTDLQARCLAAIATKGIYP
jgi:hypothetical protein